MIRYTMKQKINLYSCTSIPAQLQSNQPHGAALIEIFRLCNDPVIIPALCIYVSD